MNLFRVPLDRWCKRCNKRKPMKGGAMLVGRGFFCAACKPPKKSDQKKSDQKEPVHEPA